MLNVFFIFISFIISSCSSVPEPKFATAEEFANAYKADDLIISNSKSQKQNYLKSREHIALSYKDANSVIKMDDKESGLIIIKGLLNCSLADSYTIAAGGHSNLSFTLKLSNLDKKIIINFMDIAEELYLPPSQFYIGGKSDVPLALEDKKIKAKECVSSYKKELEQILK